MFFFALIVFRFISQALALAFLSFFEWLKLPPILL